MIRFLSSKRHLATLMSLIIGSSALSVSAVAKDDASKTLPASANSFARLAVDSKTVSTPQKAGNTSITGQVRKTSYSPQATQEAKFAQSGKASYYGPGFHGRRTASGEKFDMHDMTAAHRSLPFGTKLKVTNVTNGKTAIVRVNDRGPYSGGRVLDLSVAAAKQIGSINSGVAQE